MCEYYIVVCVCVCSFIISYIYINMCVYVKSGNRSDQSFIRLTDYHYASLLQQLSVHALKWREIGTYLGFRPGELDNICGHSLLLSPIDWLRQMLAQWLQWAPGDSRGSTSFATLEDLKTALNQAGLGATAHDFKI